MTLIGTLNDYSEMVHVMDDFEITFLKFRNVDIKANDSPQEAVPASLPKSCLEHPVIRNSES